MAICSTCGHENPEGARFCNECASPLAAAERPLAEERKIVSVVFADLVGFTARAEQLDPEDVRELLSGYHERLRAELERHSGTVEKFIGDAVMAVFGAPVTHDDDAERAVRAALAIRDWSGEQADVQVRIAVNTGEALVRLDARPSEGEALVAGDVVNTAARMQAAAPIDGVLVGETTYRTTRDAISYRECAPVDAKGKANPIRVWEAIDAVARVGVDVEGVKTPLVGRGRELELLRSLLGRVRDEGAAQLATIVGVPGIGKSRLVRELFDLVEAERELIRWRHGRCLPYGDAVTFWALGEIVKAESGILESDDSTAAERKLAAAVSRVVGDPAEARWLTEELRALVGLAGGGLSSSTAQSAWRRFLEALAERGPTVLVLEDLHWADEGLLDFVDDLVDWLRDVPLLIVGTARPELLERRPGWGGGKPNATTISLKPLRDEETAHLVAALLDRPLQLADEQRLLLERAGGNPLFAEQFVRVLLERGSAGELPESVQGLIAARLDELSTTEKALVQEAAVHGRVFWLGGVAASLDCDRNEAEATLRALERKDFVRRERRSAVADEMQYMFQHVLLRDVAYGQIPRKARADKHRKAAVWLEGLGRTEDHAELLAHHYGQALELARSAGLEDDPTVVGRAREALRAAGERALALSANDAADQFFATAIELVDPADQLRPRLLLLRARALFGLGRPGIELALEARDAFAEAGDAEGRAEAAIVAGRFAWFSGDRGAADRLIDEALEAVAGRSASPVRVEVLANKTGYHMLDGRFEDAIRFGAEALPLAEELGLDEQRARLEIVVGCAECSRGDPAGFQRIQSGIAIAEAGGAAEMVTIGYGNIGSEYQFYGRLAEARAARDEQLALSRRYGLAHMERSAKCEIAGYAYIDGRWDDALAVADELSEATEAGSRHYDDSGLFALRAWIRLARGNLDGAETDSRLAEELARPSDAQAQSMGFTGRALVAVATGSIGEAHSLATELAGIGPVVLPALNNAFPNLCDAAWVFHDLGRGDEFADAVVDPSPVETPWIDAARAIVSGDPVTAAAIVERMGDRATAAYARLRSSDATQRELAAAFYASVGAEHFLATESRRAAGKT
jgi:class 3 adenylate cyclase